MSRRMNQVVLWVVLGLLFPVSAIADSVNPATYTTSLNPGQSATITKTATINKGTPTTAKVDVFFLTDSTGSMGSLIDNVKANSQTIIDDTSTLGDVAYGVGEYKDVGDVFVYRLDQDITKDTALVKAGINMWSASGGGDFAEADLYGLYQAATFASWRTGSTRILLWFGDAPSHDPAGPSPGVTEAQATEALQTKKIKVEALNLGSLNLYGQAQRIADATGGTYYATVDVNQIVQVIKDAINQSFTTYSTVSLGTAGVPSGLTVNIVPPSYTGSYDRSIDRTFNFSVTFTAVSPGSYNFTIPVLVDGGTMATEQDTITVGWGLAFPLPGYTATTAPVSAVMDNSVLERPNPQDRKFYVAGDIIKAFNGEMGDKQYGMEWMDPWDAYWAAYQNSTHTDFFPATGGGARPLNYLNGAYLSYAGNAGYNYQVPAGTSVLATAAGKLYKCDANHPDPVNGAGYDAYFNSYIDHQNGYYSWYLYAPLNQDILDEIAANGYAQVTRGQVIGQVCAQQYVPDRLHFEVRQNGFDHANVVDPYKQGLWQSSVILPGGIAPIINFLLQDTTGGEAGFNAGDSQIVVSPYKLHPLERLPAISPRPAIPQLPAPRTSGITPR